MPSHLRASMASLWCVTIGMTDNATDYDSVEFWSNPERTGGWLTKQGEYIKTWHHRWFVLKQGKLFWFKDSTVTSASRPRDVVPVVTYLTVKGAKDILNKPNAFELSTRSNTMYFIANSKKEKEDWINSMAGAEGFVEIYFVFHKRSSFSSFSISAQVESNDGSTIVATHGESVTEALKTKEREVGMFQNEVAASQGIRIRRRPPSRPPLHYVGPFQFKLQNEGNTPRNILEEIVWNKDTEVSHVL
ncbi:hypothetical protein JHK86_016427 [Glycine max]|nr:hypothetical protein JHK86_016427 [Glycine max]